MTTDLDLPISTVADHRDPFTTRELDLVSDKSGKHDVIAMIHKVDARGLIFISLLVVDMRAFCHAPVG